MLSNGSVINHQASSIKHQASSIKQQARAARFLDKHQALPPGWARPFSSPHKTFSIYTTTIPSHRPSIYYFLGFVKKFI